MPVSGFQVTFDCVNPATLAAFWAEVFSYPPPAILDDDHAIIGDPNGVQPSLFFQRVPESKIVKNRVHLDIHGGDGPDRQPQIDTEAERLVGLGGRRLHSVTVEHEYFVVMQDPEGNEFCLDEARVTVQVRRQDAAAVGARTSVNEAMCATSVGMSSACLVAYVSTYS